MGRGVGITGTAVAVSDGSIVAALVGVFAWDVLPPSILQPVAMAEMTKTQVMIFFMDINTFNDLMN